VLVFQPVRVGHQILGTIFLKSNNDVHARLRQYVGIVCLVLLLSQGFALLLSSRMQRTITVPITELTDVARLISVDKNYSIRAVRRTSGEIGILIDSFNHMLSQIEIRELALRESEERYALATRGANDGLWDWKLPTDEVYFSPRWSQMLGYPDCDRWSGSEEWFSLIHSADLERVKAELAAHREGRTPVFACEYRMRHQNGSYIWVLSRGIAVRNSDGIATRMAGSQTDITEGKVVDPLTTLPNRLYLIDKLECSFDAARQNGQLFAALFLDLDRFKLINDSLGHAAGDKLLLGVAGRLRSSVRAGW
jgi:PAS domain S-box-containing protein